MNKLRGWIVWLMILWLGAAGLTARADKTGTIIDGVVIVTPADAASLVDFRLVQNIQTTRIFQQLEDDLSYQMREIGTADSYYFDGIMDAQIENKGSGRIRVWGNDNTSQGTLVDGPAVMNEPDDHPLDINEAFRTYLQYRISLWQPNWKTVGTVDWSWEADIYSTNSITTSGEITGGTGVASDAEPVTSPDIHDVEPEPAD